jgi:hypothetical protein
LPGPLVGYMSLEQQCPTSWRSYHSTLPRR